MNTNLQTIAEHRLRLKRMKEMAESLPPSEVRDHALLRIDVELMLLKLYVNSVY